MHNVGFDVRHIERIGVRGLGLGAETLRRDGFGSSCDKKAMNVCLDIGNRRAMLLSYIDGNEKDGTWSMCIVGDGHAMFLTQVCGTARDVNQGCGVCGLTPALA